MTVGARGQRVPPLPTEGRSGEGVVGKLADRIDHEHPVVCRSVLDLVGGKRHGPGPRRREQQAAIQLREKPWLREEQEARSRPLELSVEPEGHGCSYELR